MLGYVRNGASLRTHSMTNNFSVYATAYSVAALVLAVLDVLWLWLVVGRLYRAELGTLMRVDVALLPAVAFYLIYLLGVVVFAVMPAAASGGVWRAAGLGALLGFVAYCTYDLTNLATLNGWPVKVAMLDITWGTFITALSSAVAAWAVQQLRD